MQIQGVWHPIYRRWFLEKQEARVGWEKQKKGAALALTKSMSHHKPKLLEVRSKSYPKGYAQAQVISTPPIMLKETYSTEITNKDNS